MNNNGYDKRPLWQWVIIYLIIGGIMYAGIYYFFVAKRGGDSQPGYQTQPAVKQTSPKTPPISSTQQQSQNIITLTSNGFSPSDLTIKAGTTVTWVNKSGGSATVNSDPHPVHTDYAPLNVGNFPDGGSLNLIFDKPGKFGYHNHLNPSQRGTITVQ